MLVALVTVFTVTEAGSKLMPNNVPLEGRAACTFDTVQTSARDAALAVATRAATAVPTDRRMVRLE